MLRKTAFTTFSLAGLLAACGGQALEDDELVFDSTVAELTAEDSESDSASEDALGEMSVDANAEADEEADEAEDSPEVVLPFACRFSDRLDAVRARIDTNGDGVIDESERAAAYRERVARGDVRAASAPMPRNAPEAPRDPSAGEALRDAADIVDRLERWLEGREREVDEESERRRLRERERARRGASEDWWEEEERRLEGGR